MGKGREIKAIFFYLFLVLASFLPFIPLLNAEFVYWDDDVYIVENARVQKGITLDNIKWAFTTIYFGFYYPMTWLSHMLDCELFGLNSKMHHLTNIIWHILNTFLVFVFFENSTKEKIKSFLLATIFAVHPLNVESVGWISERKNLISGFFFLLGLNLYFIYTKNQNWRNYAFVYTAYLLGMLSKPILATFPFALILADFWPLQRVRFEKDFLFKNKGLLYEKIWFLIPLPIFTYLTIIAQKQTDALATLSYIPLKDRLAGALIAYAKYIQNFFLPLKLTALYPHLKNNYSVISVILSASLLLFLFLLFVKLIKREKIYLIGFLWFVINLTPVIGIIQVGDQARADRYMYIPMIGILMAVIYGFGETKIVKYYKRTFFIVYILIFALFSIKTYYQCQTWKNTETLFSNMIKISPNASHAYHNMAIICKERGKIDKAIEYYNKAISIDPCKAKSLNNLGTCYAEKGDYENALKCFKKAVDCNPELFQGYYNLGLLCEKFNKLDDAIYYYKKAIELKPDKGNAYNNIGICLVKKNNFEEAKNYFEKAYNLTPDNPQIVFNYALANDETGDKKAAKNLYSRALELDKNHIASRKKLIEILIKESNFDEALKVVKEGLSIYPNDKELNSFKEIVLNDEKNRKTD
ncbi:MAG: tetratricopeptide repeat protein [Acidobacteriota bacterium]